MTVTDVTSFIIIIHATVNWASLKEKVIILKCANLSVHLNNKNNFLKMAIFNLVHRMKVHFLILPKLLNIHLGILPCS